MTVVSLIFILQNVEWVIKDQEGETGTTPDKVDVMEEEVMDKESGRGGISAMVEFKEEAVEEEGRDGGGRSKMIEFKEEAVKEQDGEVEHTRSEEIEAKDDVSKYRGMESSPAPENVNTVNEVSEIIGKNV